MQDIFNLPNNEENIKVFYAQGDTNTWQVWSKPTNARFVSIFCLGGGGGGGGGLSGAAGVGRTGGGGGSASPYTKLMVPANILPDTLFIQVGIGGAGGAASGSGGAGGISYVSIAQNTTVANIVLASSNTAPGGGTSAAVGGTVGTSFTQANGYMSYLGSLQINAGIAGSSGGANSGGAVGAVTVANIITQGAGGGGASATNITANGAAVNAGTVSPLISGGTTAANGPIINGMSGWNGFQPSMNVSIEQAMFFTGGAGGGASSGTTGGNGGAAGYGCGGGGGGAGNPAGTGGRGGNGLVIITTI